MYIYRIQYTLASIPFNNNDREVQFPYCTQQIDTAKGVEKLAASIRFIGGIITEVQECEVGSTVWQKSIYHNLV
jgi:hypothetical protein